MYGPQTNTKLAILIVPPDYNKIISVLLKHTRPNHIPLARGRPEISAPFIAFNIYLFFTRARHAGRACIAHVCGRCGAVVATLAAAFEALAFVDAMDERNANTKNIEPDSNCLRLRFPLHSHRCVRQCADESAFACVHLTCLSVLPNSPARNLTFRLKNARARVKSVTHDIYTVYL